MAVNNPYALNFDGVDDYVEIPYGYGQTGSITFLVHAYVQHIDGIQEIFGALKSSSSRYNLKFQVTDNEYEVLRYDGKTRGALKAPARFNEWCYLAAVYDADSGDLSLYENGTLLVRVNNDYPIQTNVNYNIGREPRGDRYFKGMMDEICIFERALNQKEVQFYQSKQLTGKEPGLVAYYRCDNDNVDNSVLQDYTGNGNNGTIYGASYVPGFVDLDEPDPVIVAKEATNILGDTATLNGEILHLANHASLDVAFQYSPYPDFSKEVSQTPIQTITSPQIISANISGLNNSLGYYTRIMAQESS